MTDAPPTLRWDIVTARWTVLAPARVATPRDMTHRAVEVRGPEACPFCPSGEEEIRAVRWSREDAQGRWLTRAVSNRFPMVSGEGEGEGGARREGPFRERALHGEHEVLIESPAHELELPDMSAAQRERVVELYLARARAMAERPDAAAVVLFKNRGPRSGGSLRHPHAQVMSFPVVPPSVARRDRVAARHHAATGLSAVAAAVEAELRDGARLIEADDDWVVFNPFASHRGWETWIAPRSASPWFGAMDDRRAAGFADVLSRTLRRLRACTADADYNLVVRQPALRRWRAPWAGWHLEVIARRGGDAGFELAAETHCAVIAPEAAAAAMRAAGP